MGQPLERRSFVLQQFDELRSGAAQQIRRDRMVVVAHGEHIQRLGQNRGEVEMTCVHGNSPAATTRPPQLRWHSIGRANCADLDRQPNSQSEHRNLSILRLTATLIGLGLGPG